MLTHIKFDKENLFTCLDEINTVLETGLTKVAFMFKYDRDASIHDGNYGKPLYCKLINMVPDYRFKSMLTEFEKGYGNDVIIVLLKYNRKNDELTGTVFGNNYEIKDSFCFMKNLRIDYPAEIRAGQFSETTNRTVTRIGLFPLGEYIII